MSYGEQPGAAAAATAATATASDLRFAQFSISPSPSLPRREAAAPQLRRIVDRSGEPPPLPPPPPPPPGHEEESEGAVGVSGSISPESPRLVQTIGEEVRLRIQRRNQFRLSRKTAMSMDQCHVWGTMPVLPMHSHSGSDTGLTLDGRAPIGALTFSADSVQKRQSVTDAPHLRALHDSLTSLTSRITGSQESLPSTESLAGQAAAVFGRGSRSRRKIKDNREKLAEQLRQLEHGGLPKQEIPQLDAVSLDLEPSWDRVVSESSITSAKVVKQQAAIWELFQTEINILRHLKTIIEVYISVIRHLQIGCGLLGEVSTDRLFPGVGLVFRAHHRLWSEHLRPALLAARATGDRVRPTQFAPGFLHFGDIFQPCADYCLKIADAKEYLRSLEKSEAFCDFAKWAYRMSCRNYNTEDGTVDLQLKSLLTMPLQRITKYGLLLQEVLRHTDDGDERLALETMIAHTADFCNRLNASYQMKSDQEEVRVVAERLEDAKMQEWRESLGEEAGALLDRYRLDLTRPMPHNGQQRRKLCEGELRMRDEKGKWGEFKCLLFTDLLLLTKCGKRSNLRLMRPPIPLDRLLIHRLPDSPAFLLVSLTDFGSADCLLYLAGADQRVSDDWVERLGTAKAAVQAQMRMPAAAGAGAGGGCYWTVGNHLEPTAAAAAAAAAAVANQAGASAAAVSQRGATLHYTHSSSDIDTLGRAGAVDRHPASLNSSRHQMEHDVYSMHSSPPLFHHFRPA